MDSSQLEDEDYIDELIREKLYEKINNDILKKNMLENEKINDLFKLFFRFSKVLLFIVVGALSVFAGPYEDAIKTIYKEI